MVRPARCAASTFIFTPPMGSTRPRSVTSPVMPTSPRTGLPVKRLAMAMVMATPAEGPSLGVAPAGTWTCTSVWAKSVGVHAELRGLGAHVAEGDARALPHHVAELAGEGELALALHPGGLDEEDVAAHRRHGETRGDAGDLDGLGALRFELLLAQHLADDVGGDLAPPCSPAAIFATLFRQMAPIWRSRLRTPASRV